MALSDLTEKITAEAKEKAQAIAADGKKHAESVKRDYKKKQEDLSTSFARETEARIQKATQANAERALREAKQAISRAKRDALNGVFEDALSKLEALSGDDFVGIVAPLLESIATQAKGATIKVRKENSADAKAAVTKAGLTASIEEAVVPAGLIVVGDGYEYDFTFARLIADKKDALEIEIAETLLT